MAEHDLDDAVGQARLDEQLDHGEGRERALHVGPQDDRVARDQRRERVGGGQAQGVVPRRDDAHDSAGPVQLGRARQSRQHAEVPGVAQVRRGAPPVVACGDGAVADLLVRVRAGLARLELDEVEQLALAVEDEVVEAQEHGGALAHRRCGPSALGPACRVDSDRHVTRGGQRQDAQRGAGHRAGRPQLAALPGRHDAGGEGPHPGGGHGVGGGGVGLRVCDDVGHYRRVTSDSGHRGRTTRTRPGCRGRGAAVSPRASPSSARSRSAGPR